MKISNFKFQISDSSKGFTLLELVVVLSLFMLIMGVTVTIFISVVRHQKRILSQQEIVSQTTFLQELLSDSLRSAIIDTNGDCLGSGDSYYKGYVYLLTHFDVQKGFYQGIKFISKEGACQEFFLDNDGVFKKTTNREPSQPMLSSKLKIAYARFVINGNKNTRVALGQGEIQPRVSAAFSVSDLAYPESKATVIQTTISHR